jgi:hypothetical protein
VARNEPYQSVIVMALKRILKSGEPRSVESEKCGANLFPVRPVVSWRDLGNPVIGNMFWSEAIQGCTNDCYFISALSSIAWVNPALLSLYGSYYFSGQATALNTQNTPVDTNNRPIFAQIPQSGEIWAPLYEVAYAKWRSGNVNNTPDIPATIGNGGSGFQALKEITGRQNPANAEDPSNQTTADIWGKIETGAMLPIGNYQCYKTLNPSFAETKAGLGVITGIYSNHTYSLFGKINIANTGKKYIVLRNPYAHQIPEPDASVIRPAVNFFGVNLAASGDGVFALEIERFKDYFTKYGSVK